MTLRYDEVADLIKIIDASACDELILETAEIKLVVRRNTGGTPVAISTPAPVARPRASAPDEPTHAAPAIPTATPHAGTVLAAAAQGGRTVRAPMVGTFYRASSPEAAPFVDVGTVVAQGDPLCVIEVMKLFTTVYAEAGGRIAQICAADAEFVEYDRVLFVIDEPA